MTDTPCERCGSASEGLFVSDTKPRRYMCVCAPCGRVLKKLDEIERDMLSAFSSGGDHAGVDEPGLVSFKFED
jgi:hypothetical protein